MTALLIKNMPPDIHERLRHQAERHHRSMNREILAILDEQLDGVSFETPPPAAKTLRRISGEMVVKTVREIREHA